MGISGAPDYSEEQYEKLKQMPNLLTSLDLLIDLATRFYEINPNMIKNEISILTIYEGNNDLIKTRIESVNSLIELINQLSGLERIESDEQKDLVINFCLNANLVRRELLEWSIKSEPNITIKPHILNIDTLLDAIFR
jgi:signal transduction histidine kinase